MKTHLPIIAGILLILGAGWLANPGLRGTDKQLEAASAALNRIPSAFGDWTSTEVEIPERQLAMAEATGCVSREYVNSRNGHTVSLMILCGEHGPISVHPPTVCFTGAGWNLDGEPQPHELSTAQEPTPDRFWLCDFVRQAGGARQHIQTCWAWSNGSRWQAVENPRLTYAGSPYLYKMYVSASVGDEGTDGTDVVDEFLEEFLPVLSQSLKSSGT